MIVELANIEAQPGMRNAMEAALSQARAVLERAEGYRGSAFHRGIEEPDRFVLTIQWETLAYHIDGFRTAPLFPEWRSHFSHLLTSPPAVSHFTVFAEG